MTFRVTGISVLDSAVADKGDLPSAVFLQPDVSGENSLDTTAFCTGAHHFPDRIERERIGGSSHAHLNRGVTA